MPKQMKLDVDADAQNGRTHIVRVAGKMDAVGATEVWDEVGPMVSAEKPNLLLDMTEVPYLSSAGISTLISLLNRARPFGGKLAIYGCNAMLRKVFRIVALEPILNVCETLEEARVKLG